MRNSSRAVIFDTRGTARSDRSGTLGGDAGWASGINDAGQVAGFFSTAAGIKHAFITGPNGVGMTDLNSLVELPRRVILTRSIDINNDGQ